MKEAIVFAAEYHDLGKSREDWQRSIGNLYPHIPYAKSGNSKINPKGWGRGHAISYRHEFGSLLDVQKENNFNEFSTEIKELILHIIASHHGYARPHFVEKFIRDPDYSYKDTREESFKAMCRYAKLQKKYGRWGLAYLESLLRAADWYASACPTRTGQKQTDLKETTL